jgi:hypothetical protein
VAVTSYDLNNVHAVFGRGQHMGAYLSTGYYYAPSGNSATFPPNNIGMNVFINTAPTNEWACDCANCSMK